MSAPSGACCSGVSALPALEAWTEIRDSGVPALLERFRRGVENFDRRIFMLTDGQMDTAFLPDADVGRWPARVLLGHLADAELVWVHRIRRAVGEDNPVFTLWDENAFIDHGVYRPAPGVDGARSAGGFVAVLHTLRQWTAEWLGGLPTAAWARKGMHPARGAISVADMVALDTWHVEHHARFLRCKLDRLVGPEVEEPSSGGCGPSCGCRPGR